MTRPSNDSPAYMSGSVGPANAIFRKVAGVGYRRSRVYLLIFGARPLSSQHTRPWLYDERRKLGSEE